MAKALILLSGGQDSATCLAYASKIFYELHTVSFDYGQRHKVELDCAKRLSAMAGALTHTVVPINSFKAVAETALLEGGGSVSDKHPINPDLPASFVPGRNLVFLTLAAAHAYRLGIRNLVTGVSMEDYSGYPDCRETTIKALNEAINQGMAADFVIMTPLMHLSKARTVIMMESLGCLDWYKDTHTCYNGVRPGCGECPSCKLRAKGFQEAGLSDPLFK